MSNLGLLGQSAASRSAIRIIATAPRPTRSASSGIEEFEREALATRKYLFRLAVRNWGPENRAALFRGHPDLGGRF